MGLILQTCVFQKSSQTAAAHCLQQTVAWGSPALPFCSHSKENSSITTKSPTGKYKTWGSDFFLICGIYCSKQDFEEISRKSIITWVFIFHFHSNTGMYSYYNSKVSENTFAVSVLLHLLPQSTCSSSGGSHCQFQQSPGFLIQTELCKPGITAAQEHHLSQPRHAGIYRTEHHMGHRVCENYTTFRRLQFFSSLIS